MNTNQQATQVASRLRDTAQTLSFMVPDGEKVLLAVSGGSDSSGLLQMAAGCLADRDGCAFAGFVDHGLRDGTEAEWAHVERSASIAGVPALRRLISPEKVSLATGFKGGIQEWAREERYRLLAEMAKEVGALFIATAHTMDDQAETVMLRLMRGTGIDGLAGILPRRSMGDLEIIRPMLGVRREAIREALREVGVGWVEDPSNENLRFARVSVRQKLLPLMESIQPQTTGKLSALAKEAHDMSEFVKDKIEDENSLICLRLGKGVKVDSKLFERLPRSLWGRLVRAAVKQAKGDLRCFEREHLKLIMESLEAGKNTRDLPVPGDTVVQTYKGSLYVFPRSLPNKPAGAGYPSIAGFGLWRLRFAALGAVAEIRAKNADVLEQVEVRARLNGDRVWGSKTKFKEILSEAHIPLSYRDFVPVLAAEDKIISCPTLLKSRNPDMNVRWILDDDSPFLDIDFPLTRQIVDVSDKKNPLEKKREG